MKRRNGESTKHRNQETPKRRNKEMTEQRKAEIKKHRNMVMPLIRSAETLAYWNFGGLKCRKEEEGTWKRSESGSGKRRKRGRVK